MVVPKKAKMSDLVNYRLRVTTIDSRQLSGQMLAFDKFMNLVLADTEEFRVTKKARLAGSTEMGTEDRRSLGLVILRGETIVSLTVDAPPSSDPSARVPQLQRGPGIAKPVSRAVPSVNPLSGPARTSSSTASAFFGGSVPPGFQAPPGFQGR